MNLVFATDELYAKYTCVTIASILQTVERSRDIAIYLLVAEPISHETLRKIERLRDVHNFSLHQIVVDATKFKNVRTTPGISIATYFRLLMHEMLPPGIDRALYLDSDLIIKCDISPLYDLDMGNNLFSGVEDSISKLYNYKFGMAEKSRHINAGVTLFNLSQIRGINFSCIIDNYIDNNLHNISLGDQQIINCCFSDRILYAPLKWNVHGSMFDPVWATKNVGINNYYNKLEFSSAIEAPGIIHYTYKRKPWQSFDHPKTADWLAAVVLTEFREEIERSLPEGPRPQMNLALPSQRKSTSNSTAFDKRPEVHQIMAAVPEKNNSIQSQVDALKEAVKKSSDERVPFQVLIATNTIQLRDIGRQRSERRFIPSEFINGLAENCNIFTNGEKHDLEGGFHTNIKPIFKTSRISRDFSPSTCAISLVLVQRLRQDLYWQCLNSSFYGKELLFAETSFFGAYAGYYDQKGPGWQRQCFGYIVDDMGFYFDARNPSRLETILNCKDFKLTEPELKRSRKLIDRVVNESITKYNAYAGGRRKHVLEQGAVVVIDQKVNDASIEFGGADRKTFSEMLQCAIDENPDATIYFKRHPDNVREPLPSNIDERFILLPDNIDITFVLETCSKVYTVSSQVGFEALLRSKEVVVFGIPFYAGWGLTNDRQTLPRRQQKRTIEELFFAACVLMSVYIHPISARMITIEEAFDLIGDMRNNRLPEDWLPLMQVGASGVRDAGAPFIKSRPSVSGHIMYGPYRRLDPGSYHVDVVIAPVSLPPTDASASAAQTFVLEVVDGSVELARHELNGWLTDHAVTIPIDFALPSNTGGGASIEIRLWTSGVQQISIQSLTLRGMRPGA
ncbi:glycosyltransferase [Bosea sp. NPDC055353]